jgi:hypothetical protein
MRYVWALLVVLRSAAEAADLDRISNLVGQTKSYSEGKIRIAHVNTDGEPVCCSSHLLVFIPNREIGSQCFALSQKAAEGSKGQLGFNSIEFNRIASSYDPHRGLLLNVPYTLYGPDGGRGKAGSVKLRVDLRARGLLPPIGGAFQGFEVQPPQRLQVPAVEGQGLRALLSGQALVCQDGGDGLIRCLEKLGALLAPILSLEQVG